MHNSSFIESDLLLFRIVVNDVESVIQALLHNLFGALELPGSAENEYIMKGLIIKSCFNLYILSFKQFNL